MRKSLRTRFRLMRAAGHKAQIGDSCSDELVTADMEEPNSAKLLGNSTKVNNNNVYYQCKICKNTFPTMELLLYHSYEHSMTDLLQCNICDEIFSSSDSLSLHLEEHDGVLRPFKCGICDASFIRNAELLNHICVDHEGLPLHYKCRVCTLPFRYVSQLVAHLREKHFSKFMLKCGLCGENLREEKELPIHMLAHFQEFPKRTNNPICFSKLSARNIIGHDKEKGKQIEDYDRPKKVISKKKGMTKSKRKISSNIKVKVTGIKKEDKVTPTDIEIAEAENEDTSIENDFRVFPTTGRKKKELGNLKQPTSKSKPTPAIRDTDKFITMFMKVDTQNGSKSYDCDVCGIRMNDRGSFIQHRDDHFCDGKFCIKCRHCSQSFDSFQELDNHISRDKCSGYKCQICGKSFSLEPILLTHHIKEHSSQTNQDNVFICKVCCKTFDNKTAFIRHASSHSEDKCIQCKLCRHAFTTQETLLGHLRTTHSIIPFARKHYKFICDTCGSKFMKEEALTTHQIHVHNVENSSLTKSAPSESETKVNKNIKKFKRTGHWRSAEDDKKRRTCPICNKVFGRFKDLRRHLGTHTKPYLCSHCGKSFPYRYSLDAHIKAYHSTENPHKCETCNKSFSCERSLVIHQRIHTGEKPHQCHICHKNFRQGANLSMHLKLHNSDKPIKCKLCDYRCSHQGYLKRHMSTHSTEKNHVCPICNKGFTEKANLSHHLKRHLKIKDHVCAICGHRFADRYYLNSHMRIHTKEKPFVCPVCNRAFTMRPNMVSHIKKTHPSYNYQPVRSSHTQARENESNGNLVIPSPQDQTFVEAAPVTTANALSKKTLGYINHNSNADSATLTSTAATSQPPTYITQMLPSQTPLPQHTLQFQQSKHSASNDHFSTDATNLLYTQLNNPICITKALVPGNLESLSNQRLQHQIRKQQPQHMQPSLSNDYTTLPETNIQGNDNFQSGSGGLTDQNIQEQQETQQHLYKINMSDMYNISSHVDAPRIVPSLESSVSLCPNLPTLPVVSQDYTFAAYPNMALPRSDDNSCLPNALSAQGFLTHEQHSNQLTNQQ